MPSRRKRSQASWSQIARAKLIPTAFLLAPFLPACDKDSSNSDEGPQTLPPAAVSQNIASSHKKAPDKVMTVDIKEYPELSIFELEGKWKTQHGKEIELSKLQGTVFVLVMIYTSCKAACPRLIADMRALERSVSERTQAPVKYVFVSIDPKTDTPAKLLEFATEIKMTEERWLFLQGTEEGVRYLANVLAMKYKKIAPLDFSHSNIISVFNKKGVLSHQQEGLSVNNKKTVASIVELTSTL